MTNKNDWNPQQYMIFANERTKPAKDLLHAILDYYPNINPKNIVDIGCGAGNSSAILKDRFIDAKVLGVDSSINMLSKAKEAHTNIEFCHVILPNDIETLHDKGAFDIIFSNACLQWLDNHETLFPAIMKLLSPNGILSVQMPIIHKSLTHNAIKMLAKTPKWSDKIGHIKTSSILPAESYFDMLSTLTNDFILWETTFFHRLKLHNDIIAWYKSTGLKPFLDALNQKDAQEFENEILEILKEQIPIQANNEVILHFPRLFFIAKRV